MKYIINNNLRECRKRVNLKQSDVASALGFKSTDRISRWEKGTAYPHVRNLFHMAKIYGVQVEELYKSNTENSY